MTRLKRRVNNLSTINIYNWTKKMQYIYTMKYYSDIFLKEEIVPFVTTWMDLETIMLSEIKQVEKDKSHMILLIHRL